MCLSMAVIFALCSYDCSRLLLSCRQLSVLDCCDLVLLFFCVCFFFCVCVCVFVVFFWGEGGSTLCLQVGNHLGFWGGCSCFVSFIWCQLFACLIRAAIFRLPPAFVVWSFFATAFVVCSFFLCHRHLCTVSLFHGLFCRRHSCETFCLCLVSACFRVSGYLSVFCIMLCASCSSASSLEIRTGIS